MEMVTLRLISFLLVLISLQASHLAAEIHQGIGVAIATKGKELEVTQTILVDVNKRNFDEAPARSGDETKIAGGRKMKMERVLNEEEMSKDEEAARLEVPEISGRDAYASKKYHGNRQQNPSYQTNGQWTNHNAPPAEAFRYELLVSNVRRSGYTLSSEEQVPETRHDKAYQSLESQKLLAAASEIANLMNKDYPGDGKGHHKPPINNANPLSREPTQP